MEEYLKKFLVYIGENPDRPGLKDTPQRIIRMWSELFRGYDKEQKPKVTTFLNGEDGLTYSEMMTDTGDFYSNCEHHCLPFFGRYWFAYIPSTKGRILGLSKVARIVDFHAAKLQIQERLVKDIIDDLWEVLCEDSEPPLGMAVLLEGEHLCKTMRGAKKKGKFKTMMLRGVFEEMNVKQEFLNLIK